MERREALITGVVLGVLCVVIAVVVAYGRAQESPLVADDEMASDGGVADGGVADESLDEFATFVDEAIAFVEATRGRRFVTEPRVVTLSEATFVARIRADLSQELTEDPEGLVMLNATYRAMGLIGPDDSVDEVYGRFGEAGILGFYDPETDELVVRQRDELSLLTKSTIVHELTHAFDDQHFDLDRPEYDDRTDEVAWGFRAVAEGSASWVEAEWKATLSAAERDDLAREEFSFGDPGIFNQFELSFLLLELSPYEYGEVFVEHLIDTGGNAALDEALEDPPITSEQVISPDRYDAEEGAIVVAPPPADGEIVYSGLGGQVLIDSLFTGVGLILDFEWGGDQLVVWTADGRSCMRWDIQSEDGETYGVESAFGDWASRIGGADVSPLDERTVRVERCV
ncbi:MAG: hypothetical protein R2707_21020 [Acidimicrobiales bacterium]